MSNSNGSIMEPKQRQYVDYHFVEYHVEYAEYHFRRQIGHGKMKGVLLQVNIKKSKSYEVIINFKSWSFL